MVSTCRLGPDYGPRPLVANNQNVEAPARARACCGKNERRCGFVIAIRTRARQPGARRRNVTTAREVMGSSARLGSQQFLSLLVFRAALVCWLGDTLARSAFEDQLVQTGRGLVVPRSCAQGRVRVGISRSPVEFAFLDGDTFRHHRQAISAGGGLPMASPMGMQALDVSAGRCPVKS